MNNFLVLIFLFFFGCFFGWCLELLFRRFISKANPERKWINPGFLMGPYLPLYGSGLCVLFLLARVSQLISLKGVWLSVATVLIMGVCMTLLELIVGLFFVRIMNVKLWDYSREKLNYLGIICPKFSLAWTAVGAVYFFFVHPYILNALTWFSQNLAFSFVLGVFFGVFVIDVFYSFRLVTKIRRFAADNNIVVRYEELKRDIRASAEKTAQKYKFIMPFRSVTPLATHLAKYLEVRIAFDKNRNNNSKSEK